MSVNASSMNQKRTFAYALALIVLTHYYGSNHLQANAFVPYSTRPSLPRYQNLFKPSSTSSKILPISLFEGATAKSSSSTTSQGSSLALKMSAADSTAELSPKSSLPPWVTTGILVFLWYAASIVCNQSSKVLLSTTKLGAQGLTLSQFVISSVIGAVNLLVLKLTPYQPVQSTAQWKDTLFLATAVTAGFGFLNACMDAMHVSLVMVLRAAEPAVTLLLSALLLPKSQLPTLKKALLLIPVIAGAGLSSLGDYGPTTKGLILAVLCNICFGLRGIWNKRISAAYPKTDAFSEFFHLSMMGALLQAGLIAVSRFTGGAPLPSVPRSAYSTVLTAGVSFFAYVQLSWVCLSRMTAVSHSLTNSLRRPATIVAALAYAPVNTLTPTNIAGVVLACLGGLLYGIL